eukprot:g6079.t1
MLLLALGMVGTLAKDQPLDPVSWRAVHKELRGKHTMFRDMENGKLFSTMDASVCDLPSNQREQLQLMAVMASGVVATPEMFANLWDQGSYSGAEAILRKFLQGADEKEDELAEVGFALSTLATVLRNQGKLDEADPLPVRAIEFQDQEGALGPDHPSLATSLGTRVSSWKHRASSIQRAALKGKLDTADALLERAIEIKERALAPDHPSLATSLGARAVCKLDEADAPLVRAIEIRERALGPDHPSLATSLGARATVSQIQGRLDEADSPLVRVIENQERDLAFDHPILATSLGTRALVLEAQGNYDEADRLYVRCLEIRERALGHDHPALAVCLSNRAELLQAQGKANEARPIFLIVRAIQKEKLGEGHKHTVLTQTALKELDEGGLSPVERPK